jgi:urease accessory protein
LIEGRAETGFRQSGGRTRLAHLYQRDPLRVLFPTPAVGDPAIAVIVTTSGGLVAGNARITRAVLPKRRQFTDSPGGRMVSRSS